MTGAEHDALRQVVPLDVVERVVGTESQYRLRPGSHIGAVTVGDLSVLIKPKIDIRQVLALACYAIGNGTVQFQAEDFGFHQEDPLHDFLAIALAFQARKAFARSAAWLSNRRGGPAHCAGAYPV